MIAGPGSGKTSTMVSRVAHMLRSGVAAATILVLTFTTAGANEFAGRVKLACGKAAEGLQVLAVEPKS